MSTFHAGIWGPLGSLLAAVCCLGGGPLLAALSVVGLGFLVTDFVFVPLLLFFLGVTLWSLDRERRRHRLWLPLILAIPGSLLTLSGIWISALVVVLGILLVVSAAAWNMIIVARQRREVS